MGGQPASRHPSALLEPLVLASASPRRRRLLTELGYRFRVQPADVDETPPAGLEPGQVAEALAARKARAVAETVAAGTVLGADTVVVGPGGELLGKPQDAADATRILGLLSNSTHQVITAVALVHRPSGKERRGHAVTRVSMRPMTAAEVRAYVESGEPFGKAGAYAIQERGDRFVSRLEGEYDNVVGLPGRLLLELLAALALELSQRGAEQ